MGAQEWILLALVLIVPLIVAVVVTLWTLEQAIKRNKKNQPNRRVRRVAEPVAESDAVNRPDAPDQGSDEPARMGANPDADKRASKSALSSDGVSD